MQAYGGGVSSSSVSNECDFDLLSSETGKMLELCRKEKALKRCTFSILK